MKRYRVWFVNKLNATAYTAGCEKNPSWLRVRPYKMTTIECDDVAVDGVKIARERGAKNGDMLIFNIEMMVVTNRYASSRPHVIRLHEGQDGHTLTKERQALVDEIRRADEQEHG